MLNFNEIKDLFGTPLNQVPKPSIPKTIKLWHIAVIGIVGYLSYRGAKIILNESRLRVKRRDE